MFNLYLKESENMLSVKKIFAISTLSLCMSFAYADNTTTSVNSDLENLSNQISIKNKVKEYDDLLSQLTTQVDSSQNEINAIDARIKTAKGFIADIDPLSESSDNLDKLNSIVDTLVSRKTDINKTIDDKKTRIGEILKAKSEFVDNQAKLATQDKSNSVMQTAIEQSKTEYSKLEEQKKELEKQASDYEKVLAERKASTENLKKQKDDYDNFIKKIDAEIKVSQDTLEKKKAQAEKYKKELFIQQSQNEQLSSDINKSKEDYKVKVQEQKDVQKANESQLNKEIAETKKQSDSLIAEKTKIIQQNEALTKEIENAKKVYKDNTESKEKISKMINVLQKDLINGKEKIKQLNAQTAALFDDAKKSIIQNNQNIDAIDIGATQKEINSVNVTTDDIQAKTINPQPNVSSNIKDEKNLIITKSMSPTDPYVQARESGAPLTKENIYTVKKGDSISLIVQRQYKLTSMTDIKNIVDKIEKVNNLGNSNIISVGQQLILP